MREIFAGDVLVMKKPHPCGCRTWTVLRNGDEMKLRCQGCGHEILAEKEKIEKKIKEIRRTGQ